MNYPAFLPVSRTGGKRLTLDGTNTYDGPAIVAATELFFARRVSLYDGQTSSWTVGQFRVASGVATTFSVDGVGAPLL